MVIQIMIGALGMSGILFLVYYTHKKQISISWWGWLLTVLGVLYAIFVLEVIIGFLSEGNPQAAAVMGSITGLLAVIWGVLLARFVFSQKKNHQIKREVQNV